MNDYLIEAREELKRLEHIIYVSLKYTRTVDVILNALNRCVSTFDLTIEGYLQKAVEEGKMSSIPKSPALCARRLQELYPDDEKLHHYLKYYHFLKTILKKPHVRRQEFRRHVTLIVELDKHTAEICIDNLGNAERFLHQFFRYAWETLVGKIEEDEYA